MKNWYSFTRVVGDILEGLIATSFIALLGAVAFLVISAGIWLWLHA